MIVNSVSELIKIVKNLKYSENDIGITSGCFDLLHSTQINYLNRCKQLCEFLIVLIDSNELIQKHKSKYPIINEIDRTYCVSNLKCVDITCIISSIEDYKKVINAFKSSKTFKNESKIYNTDIISTNNLVIIKDIQRLSSTSEIIQYVQNINNIPQR